MTALAEDTGRCNYGSAIPRATWKAAANQTFYKGAIVIKKSDGFAYVGVTATGAQTLGVAAYALDTTGDTNGDHDVVVEPGTFGDFDNSTSSDAIAEDDRGKQCYVVNDNTVALTDGGSTRSAAGMVYDIADDGSKVVVQFEVIR